MKYILYVFSFFCMAIGGGAWFFYGRPVGAVGIVLSLYILYRLERQPRLLSLKLGRRKGKSAGRYDAAFEKAVADFNRMEGERWGLTDPKLRETTANMQHIARNLLYYLKRYPERIPLAEPFINYYQDRAVFLVHKYKQLAVTGLKTQKVVTTKQKVRNLLVQMDAAYENQFTEVLQGELQLIDGEVVAMTRNLENRGVYRDDAAGSSKRRQNAFSRWKQRASNRFDAYTDGSFSSITPELRHKINEERLITAALAFFLGSFGIHHFYMKRNTRGYVYAAFCWTFIPGFLGIVEGMRFMNMTTDEFYYASYLRKYRA